MRAIRQSIDIEELADGFADSAHVLRRFGARGQLLVLDEEHICAAEQARNKEGQFVSDVGGILAQGFKHKAVRKRARRIQDAVGNREKQRQQGLGILVIARLLTGRTQLVVFRGLGDAQRNHADGHQRDGGQLPRVHVADAAHGDRSDGHQRAGRITDRGRNGQFDVAQTDIAHRHRDDVEHGDGQIGHNDLHVDLYAVYEDLKTGVQTHHNADRHDHL